MKRLLSLILVVAMVLSLGCTTAFAAEPEASGSETFDNNNGAATDTFNETGDNETTIDEYYSLTKSAGVDDGTKDYYVTVAWSRTSGSATINGDTYHWDASAQQYVRTTEESGLTGNNPATVDITVTNYSNAEVNYIIDYTTATGYSTTEATTSGSKSGTIASYENGCGTIEEGGTVGEASYAHSHTAPSANYKGSVTLNANDKTKAAFTNQIIGTYTVNITAGAVTEQSVTKTVNTSENTKLTADVTPGAEVGKQTTVEFPKEITALTNGSEAKLTVDAKATLAAAVGNFTVSDSDNNTAIGALDLTLKVNGTPVSSFKNSGGGDVAVTVTTYVAKNIQNIKLSYGGTAFTEVGNKADVDADSEFWYDETTGELVFATKHFSTFVVEGSNVAYIESKNTAYTTLADAVEAAAANDTITVLKDCETGSDRYGITKEATDAGKAAANPIVLDDANVTLDLNDKTITTTHNYSFIIAGNNDIVKNGTIQSGERKANAGDAWGSTGDIYRGYPLVVATLNQGTTVTGVQVNNVIIKGGISAGGSAENNATPILGGAEVTLVDCIISGGASQTLYAQLGSTLTVVSGTYSKPLGKLADAEKADAQHLGEAASTIIIKGGTFNNEDPSAYVASGYVAAKSGTAWTVSAVQ